MRFEIFSEIHKHTAGYLTNIKPPPRTLCRTGSGRRPRGRSRRRGPAGTKPSRHSSPPSFPSPSIPTHSARTCNRKTADELEHGTIIGILCSQIFLNWTNTVKNWIWDNIKYSNSISTFFLYSAFNSWPQIHILPSALISCHKKNFWPICTLLWKR